MINPNIVNHSENSYQQLIQKSYLMLCLKCFKPQFEVKQIVKETPSYNIFCHVIVFDVIEQKNKMLIVQKYTYSKYLEEYQEILNKSFRNDIILNLLDQYFLDTDQLFYIYEMEHCNMTLLQFINLYKLNSKIFDPLLNEIGQYITSQYDKIFTLNFDISQYYVNVINSNRIEVKINLIHEYKLSLYYLGNNQISHNDELQTENNSNELELEETVFQDLADSEKIKGILKDLCEQVNVKIKKNGLSDLIQNKFSKILQFHQLEIFQIIQQHPLYDAFEIKRLDNNYFELIVEKRGQQIRLIAEKFNQISMAEQIEQKQQNIEQKTTQAGQQPNFRQQNIIQLDRINSTYDDFNISNIRNLNELPQKEINLLQNYQFDILNEQQIEQNQQNIEQQTTQRIQQTNFRQQNIIQLDRINSRYDDFNISNIINLNELPQKEINLLQNYQFAILNMSKGIQVLIFDDNVYYLIGQKPYIIFNHQEFQSFKEIYEVEEDLNSDESSISVENNESEDNQLMRANKYDR
ncbi:hypothetical protein TTHERM_00377240 (macronuclear) [Tetrahymena thermophila SB210]|uniref:Uncharacterized protein n=1 Tax=Tetrahymena thermophila (strain SB210) TaxID=312017 RepID=Q23FJ4_TETTS|nr:hypothetical protein TTHERM_00377240 [Tetrahymena thermophila SB210]EAR95159.2 hypothetical protein TTHERM_00377240 [Tetrahymena thermophila SB210]|eukprot:XP_001015404.2 hypothetical protein TTHERM_00377240 [Tetrahymena thermophila SB210]